MSTNFTELDNENITLRGKISVRVDRAGNPGRDYSLVTHSVRNLKNHDEVSVFKKSYGMINTVHKVNYH